MKRSFSFFLAVLIGWGSVTQPARAFLPPVIYAAYMTSSVSGATYSLAALAGVIGVTGMYLTIEDALHNKVNIPTSPQQSSQVPAPVAPATVDQVGGQAGLVPQSGETCQAASDASSTGGYLSPCDQCVVEYAPLVSGRHCRVMSFNPSTVTWERTGKIYDSVTTAGTPGSCPSGYVSSGTGCVLDNPRQATDDKTCDILLMNGQFATASDMNCPSTVDGSKLSPMIRDGKVIAYGTNSSGQPLMWEVTPGAQTYTIKQYEQVQTATQTQVKTTAVSVDSSTSAVTSVQSSTAPGSISSPSSATAPSVTTSADPTTATNTPTVTKDETKPADLQTCGLPGTPACNINDSQFDGKDNFTIPRNSEINDKLDQNKTQLENSKDSLPTITGDWLPSLMPGNATSCQPLVFDFTLHNRTTGTLSAPNVQLDICDKLELVRSILGYMLGMWTVWYVWRRFTTVNQGA